MEIGRNKLQQNATPRQAYTARKEEEGGWRGKGANSLCQNAVSSDGDDDLSGERLGSGGFLTLEVTLGGC